MKPAGFAYARPEILDDAIALMSAHQGEAKVIAGGQSLMPMLAFRLSAPRLLVDIGRIPNLNFIRIGADGVHLGALVRWRDIEQDQRLTSAHPLLIEAVRHVAHYQIRNRGTVGGSLAHADPAAEMPSVAVACDAQIGVVGTDGLHLIPTTNFFTGPLTTVLRADELITEVHLPAWRAGRRWAFEEFSRRRGDFALAGVALFYDLDRDEHIIDPHMAALGVSDRPLRLAAAEATLVGRRLDARLISAASAAACEAIEFTSDIHAPADYRRALLGTLIERALFRASGLTSLEKSQ